MKLKQFSTTSKLIFLSILFLVMLLAVRVYHYHSLEYLFYPWNIFLAIIPFLLSSALLRIKQHKVKRVMLFALWLLFFPNAPYLLTDIFHFQINPSIPSWFDLLIVASGAWTGLLICFISLRQIEIFCDRLKKGISRFITPSLILLSSYGVYIGRYLRYNSWDVLVQPAHIIKTSGRHVLQPFDNLNVWLFTFIFAAFLSLVFFSIKNIRYVTA